MPLCGAGAAARLWLLCGRAGVAALGVCARDCAVYDSSCRAVPKHIFAGRFAGWHQGRDVEGGGAAWSSSWEALVTAVGRPVLACRLGGLGLGWLIVPRDTAAGRAGFLWLQ